MRTAGAGVGAAPAAAAASGAELGGDGVGAELAATLTETGVEAAPARVLAFGGAVVEQAATHNVRPAKQAAVQIPRVRVDSIYTSTSTILSIHINLLSDLYIINGPPSRARSVENFDTTLRTAPSKPAFCPVPTRQSVAHGALPHS